MKAGKERGWLVVMGRGLTWKKNHKGQSVHSPSSYNSLTFSMSTWFPRTLCEIALDECDFSDNISRVYCTYCISRSLSFFSCHFLMTISLAPYCTCTLTSLENIDIYNIQKPLELCLKREITVTLSQQHYWRKFHSHIHNTLVIWVRVQNNPGRCS